MNNERLQEIKEYFNTGIHDDVFPERLRQSVCMAGELFYAYEQAQAELVEAQQTIRMAYSDLPDKRYDAEATLNTYMNNHNLEEW